MRTVENTSGFWALKYGMLKVAEDGDTVFDHLFGLSPETPREGAGSAEPIQCFWPKIEGLYYV